MAATDPGTPQTAAPSFAAVVAAAGSGRRMGGRKKPYLLLRGRPILDHALDAFAALDECIQLICVLHPDEHRAGEVAARLREDYGIADVAPGGPTRQESVLNALELVRGDVPLVLIHDAVRPLVSADLIRSVARAADQHGAAIAAVPVKETVKEVGEGGRIVATPPRDRLWRARSPQGFRADLIRRAHRAGRDDGFLATDDAQLVERLGVQPVIVEDREDNLKITTWEDLVIAEAILRWQQAGRPTGPPKPPRAPNPPRSPEVESEGRLA